MGGFMATIKSLFVLGPSPPSNRSKVRTPKARSGPSRHRSSHRPHRRRKRTRPDPIWANRYTNYPGGDPYGRPLVPMKRPQATEEDTLVVPTIAVQPPSQPAQKTVIGKAGAEEDIPRVPTIAVQPPSQPTQKTVGVKRGKEVAAREVAGDGGSRRRISRLHSTRNLEVPEAAGRTARDGTLRGSVLPGDNSRTYVDGVVEMDVPGPSSSKKESESRAEGTALTVGNLERHRGLLGDEDDKDSLFVGGDNTRTYFEGMRGGNSSKDGEEH